MPRKPKPRLILKCSYSGCGKTFKRKASEVHSPTPCCSKSCSAKIRKFGQIPHRKAAPNTACTVCGEPFHLPPSHLARVEKPTCSRHCNGILRGQEWAKHAHEGRAAWTEQSEQSYREKMTGANNPAWKGGVTYHQRKGKYPTSIKYVLCPPEYLNMARKDGYVMEHRLIVAQRLGRPLLRSEAVHHINHDATDNRPENLELFANNSEHKRHEGETGYFKSYYSSP